MFGRIENRSYDDKDGIKRHVSDIIADQVEFLGGKQAGDDFAEFNQESPAPKQKTNINSLEPIDDENLPF